MRDRREEDGVGNLASVPYSSAFPTSSSYKTVGTGEDGRSNLALGVTDLGRSSRTSLGDFRGGETFSS